jgi:hypothetical protein
MYYPSLTLGSSLRERRESNRIVHICIQKIINLIHIRHHIRIRSKKYAYNGGQADIERCCEES